MRIVILIYLLFYLASCKSGQNKSEESPGDYSFAKNFIIVQYPDYQLITIKNPWQKSKDKSFSYILAKAHFSRPDSISALPVINIPVERVVVFSTTHVGYISALGKSSSIVGVSGKDFINDTVVCKSIKEKNCLDIGFAPNIDFESILMLKPDLVFLYGLDPSVAGLVNRLKEAGIQSVLVSEFLEDHPLGKAEWIKFFAAFYSCESTGSGIFTEVMKNYIAWKDSAAESVYKPTVLVGLPWKDTWYMAGGKSFTAKFIEDAGGNYLWSDNQNTDFIPLDLESVFQKAANADIWINTGSALNKTAISSVDQRLQHISAFRNGMLFNNNLRLNTAGGNDFWESGAVRPDMVLRDMISIFHQDKFGKHDFYYYRKLE